MSADAESPRPPRRAGPKSSPKLPAPTEPVVEGSSTFLPNPGRPGTRPPAESAAPGSSAFVPTETPRGRAAPGREPTPVSGGPGWLERTLFGRVSTTHLAQFSRQFGAYLDAGVDLLRSLDSLRKQFARTALGPVLERVALSVRRGDSLADAMGREPQAFDAQFLAMMRVAEARGGVPEVLKRMATGYEAKQRLIRQARSALIYPIAVVTIAFGVGMLLTLFVLPGLVEILEDTVKGRGIALPLPTRILLAINTFMLRMGWLVVPLALIGSIVGLIGLYRKPRGKAFLDEIGMRLPVLGKLLRMIDTTRFARTLGALLEAGVDVGASLDLTAGVMTLVPFRRAVRGAREAVLEGTELSDALRASRRFAPDVIAIVGSGEETGKLPESLDRLADDYEERVTFLVKNLGSLIQPLIFLLLGGIVLFIALAFFSVYIMLLTSL